MYCATYILCNSGAQKFSRNIILGAAVPNSAVWINYLYCKLRHSLLSQSLDMFLSDSVDFSCLIAKSVGQYNTQNDIFLANITRTQ